MSNNIGLNTGFLYNTNNNNTIYFIDDRGQASPENNPEFIKCIKKTSQLFFLTQKRHAISFSKALIDFANKIQKKLNETELSECISNLEQTLKNYNIKTNQTYHDKSKQLTYLLAELLHWAFLPYNTIDHLNKNGLFQDKGCLSLLEEHDVSVIMNEIFDILVDIPFMQKILLNKKLFQNILTSDQILGKFSDRGELFHHDESSAPLLMTNEDKEFFTNVLQDNFLQLPQIVEKFESNFEKIMHHISEKTEQYVNSNKDALFIFPQHFRPLTKELNLLLEQVKTTVCPRGFLWSIECKGNFVGYLLGSIHVSNYSKPMEIFKNKIVKLLKSCDSLAVELDVTNKENKRREIEIVLSNMNEKQKQNWQKFLPKPSHDLDISSHNPEVNLAEITLLNDITPNSFDRDLLEEAKKLDKQVMELETIESHTEGLTSSPLFLALLKCLDQDLLFDKEDKIFISENKQESHEINQIEQIYTSGLTENLEILFNQHPQEEQLVLNKRNLTMTHKIMQIIAENSLKSKTSLLVAGALHFAGNMAIHKMLKNMGYKIEQVIVEEELN